MADKKLDEHFQICKVCGVNKRRKRKGAFRRKGRGPTPRWVSDDGRAWNGLTCPECHCKRTTVRNSIREILNEPVPQVPQDQQD